MIPFYPFTGFDPWNESTKALQDLIEKESSLPQQPLSHLHPQQPPHIPHPHPTHDPHHPHMSADRLHVLQQQQQQQHMRAAAQAHAQQQQQGGVSTASKPLPPGFTPHHVTSNAFPHNPCKYMVFGLLCTLN